MVCSQRDQQLFLTREFQSVLKKRNGKKNLLQLADVCCSSFAQAIKYNTDKEWEYVIKLGTNIYSSNKGNIIGYGIKFYPPINWVERYKRLMYLK